MKPNTSISDTTQPALLKLFSLAAASGILLGFSVNEWHGFSFSFTAWIALVPAFISFQWVDRFSLHAALSYLVSAIYITFALGTFLITSTVAGLLVIFFGAVLFSLPMLSVYWFKQRIGYVKSLLVLAFLWSMYDYWVIEKLLELPILVLSITQSAYPALIQYIDITGYTGIATWIITLNTTIYVGFNAWMESKGATKSNAKFATPLQKAVVIVVLHFAIPLFYQIAVKYAYSDAFERQVTVLSIQEAYPEPKLMTDSSWVGILESYVAATDSATKDRKPDLIVWPENAIGVQFKEQNQVQELLFTRVLEWEATLLSGGFDIEYIKPGSPVPPLQKFLNRDFHLYNSAILLTPQLAWNVLEGAVSVNQVNVYRKEFAMPFTEKVPLSDRFPVLSYAAVEVGNLSHLTTGKNEGILRFLAKGRFTTSVQPLICWDLLFSTPETIRKNKPDIIAGLANESHFGKVLTTMPNGLVGYSRMRSIEYRRSVVKTSPMGFSFTFNPFGEITHQIPWLTNGYVFSEVSISNVTSFYVKHPSAYPIFALLIILFLVLKTKTNRRNS